LALLLGVWAIRFAVNTRIMATHKGSFIEGSSVTLFQRRKVLLISSLLGNGEAMLLEKLSYRR
jgi:hypothetical protein